MMEPCWALYANEDSGPELVAIFADLEQAKHHLETRYPFLEEWIFGVDGIWRSWTGKHGVFLDPASYYPRTPGSAPEDAQ